MGRMPHEHAERPSEIPQAIEAEVASVHEGEMGRAGIEAVGEISAGSPSIRAVELFR